MQYDTNEAQIRKEFDAEVSAYLMWVNYQEHPLWKKATIKIADFLSLTDILMVFSPLYNRSDLTQKQKDGIILAGEIKNMLNGLDTDTTKMDELDNNPIYRWLCKHIYKPRDSALKREKLNFLYGCSQLLYIVNSSR